MPTAVVEAASAVTAQIMAIDAVLVSPFILLYIVLMLHAYTFFHNSS